MQNTNFSARKAFLFFLIWAAAGTIHGQVQQFERRQTPVNAGGQPLPEAFTGGLNAPQVSPADLNQDGFADLVVFDRAGFVVLTYLNSGEPGPNAYRYAPEYACNFPVLNDYALLRDFNQDGAADIFCKSHPLGTNEIQVYEGFYENQQLHFKPFLFSYPTCPTCDPRFIYYPDTDQPGFWNNFPIAPSDVPGFDDVDGDGDLDILAFEFGTSTSLYWMRNSSAESGFGPDSLHFELVDRCWGKIYESGLERCRALLSPDPNQCASPFTGPNPGVEDRNNLHPGATITLYDQDGDGDKDLVLGGVNFDCLAMLTNGGTPQKAWMNAQDTAFPQYDVPVQLQNFVSSFYLDMNNDGRQDMLACVNNPTSGEDRNGMWFYANTAVNGHQFELQTKRFLIDRTLDFGTAAHPAFADVNDDGLMDLVVGNYGFYTPGVFENARLFLLLNTGTANAPAFTLVDEDWLGLSAFTPDDFDFSPAFGDVDNDGDTDLLIGTHNGYLFTYINSAGPDQPLNLSRDFNPMWAEIKPGGSTTPYIVDLNKDGLNDLVIGERTGNLNYYQNAGTQGAPVFASSPTLSKLGNIDVRNQFEAIGYSVPLPVLRPDGSFWLLVGAQNGQLFMYRDLAPTSDPFPLETAAWGNLDEGNRSHPALVDLDGDGVLDLVVGNRRGGLSLFRTELVDCTTSAVGASGDIRPEVSVWPNPSTGHVWLQTGVDELFTWRAFDANGRLTAMGEAHGPVVNLETKNWPSGVYMILVAGEKLSGAARVLVRF